MLGGCEPRGGECPRVEYTRRARTRRRRPTAWRISAESSFNLTLVLVVNAIVILLAVTLPLSTTRWCGGSFLDDNGHR